MNFSANRPRGWRDRLLGWGLVGALHVGLGWVVLRGADTEIPPAKPMAVEVRLLEAAPPPALQQPPPPPLPSPPPPPRQAAVPPRPRPAPPSPAPARLPVPAPAPVPTPEVLIPAPEAPSLPLSPAVPLAPPKTAPAPPAAAVPATVAIGVACRAQAKPVMPRRALLEGLEGAVTARITLKSGKVIKVDITQSRPSGLFDAAVRNAVYQYRCDTPGDTEVIATQVFEFKLDGAD